MANQQIDMEKFRIVMREFERGTLRDSHGNKVTSRKQALAIAFSEARKSAKRKRKHKRKLHLGNVIGG